MDCTPVAEAGDEALRQREMIASIRIELLMWSPCIGTMVVLMLYVRLSYMT